LTFLYVDKYSNNAIVAVVVVVVVASVLSKNKSSVAVADSNEFPVKLLLVELDK
jgi:hypothetical protein